MSSFQPLAASETPAVTARGGPDCGFCVPLFAMPGAGFFRTPAWTALDSPAAVDAAVEAERLEFDSVWVADHLIHGHDGGILEGWTTLCVIAGRTQRVRLGTIHMAQALRPPSMGAKVTATLDALSDGRFIMFYDWGGEAEAKAYGLPYPAEEERVDRLDEGIRLIKALWAAEAPLDFAGRFYQTAGAVCRPKPVQRPHPPVWIGEARNEAWCDLIARQADGFNSVPATPERLAEKLANVRAACERAGRDFGELELSLEMQILVAPTERAAKQVAQRIAQLPAAPRRSGRRNEAFLEYLHAPGDDRPLGDLLPDWLAGSPEAVAAQMRRYMELGVSHFLLWFVDFPSLDGMRLFAEEVRPRLGQG